MPASRTALEHRLDAATPDDTVRGVVFNAAFEVIEEHDGEEVARRCDPTGKGKRTPFLSYPVADYLQLAWTAVDELESAFGTADRVFFAMGHRALSNVFASPVLGSTLKAIGGGTPRQMLANVHPGYRATVSYGDRSVVWPAERHARITFRRDFLVPSFHCGVLTSVLETLGARNVRVTGRETGHLEAVYDVVWDD